MYLVLPEGIFRHVMSRRTARWKILHWLHYDIERILQIMNANDEIDRVYINFCNPWPKMRHHKNA